MRRSSIAMGIAFALSAVVLAGCASGEPPAPPKEPVGTAPIENPAAGAAAVPMGTSATSGDWTVVVRRSQRQPSAGGATAAAGNELVVVTLELTNGSTQEQGTGPAYFALNDETGTTYQAAQTNDEAFIFNTPQPLAAGETREVSIAYEVPTGAGPFVLAFTPFLEGGEPQPALLEVR